MNKENTSFLEGDNTSNSVFDTQINMGLVIRVPLKQSDNIKKILLQNNCQLIYQRISTNPLWICEEKK